jgi:hypothetical protein
MALVVMLRPSDIAPKGVFFNPTTRASEQLVFGRQHVEFHADGSVSMTFMGIKNDQSRCGYKVLIRPHSDAKMDPVQALRTYMQRTSHAQQELGNPVFVALQAPYKPLQSATVAKLLEQGIVQAGLCGRGYSAKSYRPTGATYAIDAKIDPEVVMKMGRWRTRPVFYEHYVHSKTPADYSDNVLRN